MELPSSLISSTIEENKIYYFTARSPIGIPEHMHICIRKHDKLLLFSTCTSQMDTVYRHALLKKLDMSTFPCFKKDSTNLFETDYTFVNCNNIISCSQKDFIRYLQDKVIIPFDGVISNEAMQMIADGVKKSKTVVQEIKDLF